MHTCINVLKRDLQTPSPPAIEKEAEERKRLRVSLKEAEQARLFEEFRVKDVQKDVQSRDAIIQEKDKQIAALLPLYQENITLRKRNEDLQASLLLAAKTNQTLETRLTKQANEMATAFEKRLEAARNAAMDTINEHVQSLFILFQKHTDPKTREQGLADFVAHADAVRTAVGINLT